MTNIHKAVLIEKIVTGGYGLGHLDSGKVVLVLGVIPGERVDLQIFRAKKSYDLGFVTAIVESSPKRIEPLCPLAGQCGGCTLQHLSYADQVLLKQDVFVADWQRYFKDDVPLPDMQFLEAGEPFAYRQRIRLHSIEGEPCFYRHHSTKPIRIEECFLAKGVLNECLDELDSSDDYGELCDYVDELVLHHNPVNKLCGVELFFSRKLRPTDQKRIARLLHLELIQTIRVYGPSKELLLVIGDDQTMGFSMKNKYGDFDFGFIPGDFCQINMSQNQQMLDFIMARVDHNESRSILDLFCGLGNFSIPLAKMGHNVLGIDLKRSSIRSAESNCTLNGVEATFSRMLAADGLAREIKSGSSFDVVLLDPPRAGFKEGVPQLAKVRPQKIFYIACDQQTQMRDVRALIGCGYKVVEVCLVDMFPQTHHLESLVVLEPVTN